MFIGFNTHPQPLAGRLDPLFLEGKLRDLFLLISFGQFGHFRLTSLTIFQLLW
jgi:hypothetical protein